MKIKRIIKGSLFSRGFEFIKDRVVEVPKEDGVYLLNAFGNDFVLVEEDPAEVEVKPKTKRGKRPAKPTE